jgi:predicted DNA-binding transcriptional regulator AlpA
MSSVNKQTKQARLITKQQVLDRVPLTYPAIWGMMRTGRFPRSRAVGSRSMWVEAEVDAWIANLPNRKLKGDRSDSAAIAFRGTEVA